MLSKSPWQTSMRKSLAGPLATKLDPLLVRWTALPHTVTRLTVVMMWQLGEDHCTCDRNFQNARRQDAVHCHYAMLIERATGVACPVPPPKGGGNRGSTSYRPQLQNGSATGARRDMLLRTAKGVHTSFQWYCSQVSDISFQTRPGNVRPIHARPHELLENG